jgi:hypothetical protein
VFERETSVLSVWRLDNPKDACHPTFPLKQRNNAENASGWIMKWAGFHYPTHSIAASK